MDPKSDSARLIVSVKYRSQISIYGPLNRSLFPELPVEN